MNEKTITWGKAALVRAVKTAAQTAAATIGTTLVMSEVNWILVLSAAGISGLLSILTTR